jgi:hypothetical protein
MRAEEAELRAGELAQRLETSERAASVLTSRLAAAEEHRATHNDDPAARQRQRQRLGSEWGKDEGDSGDGGT